MSAKQTQFETIAKTLALRAVSGPAGAEKQADLSAMLNSPYTPYVVGGLGGAGLGAVLGATQPKRKGRNALYYGSLGGLGGLGLAHLWQQANSGAQKPPGGQKQPEPNSEKTPEIKPPEKNPNIPDGQKTLKRPEVETQRGSQARQEAQLRAQVVGEAGPTRVMTDTLPDIGADSRLSDYENWKLNPKWRGQKSWAETLWPGNWMRSEGLRDAEHMTAWAKERAALKQELNDSVKIPFKSRPTLRQIREKYNLPGTPGFESVNPLMKYKDYDLRNPETLELIRRARDAGFAEDIDGYMQRVRENQERLGDASTNFM
jgi:hypothetical protein